MLNWNSTSKSNPTTKGHAARSTITVPANQIQPQRATQHARLKQYQQIKSNHIGPRSTLDWNSTSQSIPTTKGHAARLTITVPANQIQPQRATQHARVKQYQQIKSNHQGPRSTLDYNSTSKSNPTTKGHAARSTITVPANQIQPQRATQHARLKQYQQMNSNHQGPRSTLDWNSTRKKRKEEPGLEAEAGSYQRSTRWWIWNAALHCTIFLLLYHSNTCV